jgi:quercetin dioxygenase-like cupin family protein
MTRLVCILGLALVAAGNAAAAAKPPITAQTLGSAQILASAQVAKSLELDLSKRRDIDFVQVKIKPGGSFGWHTHRSAVAVAVVAGTLTLYDSSDPTCAAHSVSAGHGFIEPENHVHLARNEGTTPLRVLVAYLGVPSGKSPDVPASQPDQCSAVK